MNYKKSYDYGYQPLDEFSYDNGDEADVHKNLANTFELKDVNDTDPVDSKDDLQENGISVLTAGIFIIGEICGAGVVAFPAALSKTGLFGFVLIVVTVLMCVYCGVLLGHSWRRVKELRTTSNPIRDPYPYIGEVAVGKGVRHGITFCLNFQLFFTCVVYLLLSAEIISSFVSFHIGDLHHQANLRIWLLIVALIILPFTWLGSPKDFWFIAIAAAATTTIAVVLLLTKFGMIHAESVGVVKKADVTFYTFASAFGTFVFGFTGASLFPTIQSDMRKPNEFTKAALIGYVGIFLLYVPTALGGYLTIGIDLKASILKTLAHYDKVHHANRAIVSITEILFATHFISGFVLMINPFVQQLEEFIGVPYKFSAKRVGVRSAVLLSILISCEIFPQFGPIVDLVGGSVNVFLCFIFPIWCYLYLYPDTKTWEKVIMIVVVIIACLGGIASTVSNVLNIKTTLHELYFAENATGHPK